MFDIFLKSFGTTATVLAPLMVFLIILLIIIFFVRFLVRSLSQPRIFPRVNGIAGAGIGQVKRFSKENIAKGVAGEELTGQMLQSLIHEDNNVYVFHNLRFPGSKVADVDHMVIAGKRIAVIDSKMWTSGYFFYTKDGIIIQKRGRSSHPRRSFFHVAVERYRQLLPNCAVYGWYFIHSHDGEESTCSPDVTDFPRLSLSSQGLEEIRWWLSGDENTYPKLLNKISSYRK